MALVLFAKRRGLVREWTLRNLAAGKFAGQGVSCEQSVGRIGQCFADAVQGAVIRWNQSVLLRESCGHTQARCAGCGDESGLDQLAAREVRTMAGVFGVPVGSVSALVCAGVGVWPVMVALVRLLNPARTTMMTCTSRKSRSARDTKK